MPQLLNGIIYIIIYKDERNICLKRYANSYFVIYIFLNSDNSVNNVHRLLKFSMSILDMTLGGTVSQIFYLDPSSDFFFSD